MHAAFEDQHLTGSPLNRENGQINSVSGQVQGILFVQVINSLLLKIQDILILAQISEVGTENFQVDREKNTRNLQIGIEWCEDPE